MGDSVGGLERVMSEGPSKAFVVLYDRNLLVSAPVLLDSILSLPGLLGSVPLDCSHEPTYEYLDEVRDQVRLIGPTALVVGIGGGSALDITKATGALAHSSRASILYRGFDKIDTPGLETFLIPTTAGSGSEATPNAVFTDTAIGLKLGVNGRYVSGKTAVLDASWQAAIPREVALSSGLDALVHALESFVTINSSTLTHKFSAFAANLIMKNFTESLSREVILPRKQEMLEASYIAATALFNSGSGISGALSYVLGVAYGVPHGMAGGITLPYVVKWNIDHGYYKYGLLAAGNHAQIYPDDTQENAYKFLDALFELYAELGVPSNFARWNLSCSDVPLLKEKSRDLQIAFDQNPIPFSASSDLHLILEQVLPA